MNSNISLSFGTCLERGNTEIKLASDYDKEKIPNLNLSYVF